MHDLVGRQGVKHDEGAVGVLTGGLLSRRQTFAVAVSYALAPFVAPDLYGTG